MKVDEKRIKKKNLYTKCAKLKKLLTGLIDVRSFLNESYITLKVQLKLNAMSAASYV